MKTAVVLHHSATADSGTVSWDAIKKYHMGWKFQGRNISEQLAKDLITHGVRGVEKPWHDIGYNAGVERVGDEYRIMQGRPWDAVAAAVREARMNELGVHICVVGDFDKAAVPTAQWFVVVGLVHQMMRDILHTDDTSVIHGHREYAPYKSCPGRLFDLNQLRLDVGRV